MFQVQFRKLHKLFSINFIAALGFLLFTSVTTAQAQQTFADFLQTNGNQKSFTFTNNGTSGTFGTVAGGNPIQFRYVGITGLPADLSGFQNARLTITDATTFATGNISAGNTTQPNNRLITITVTRDVPLNGNNILLRIQIAGTNAGLPAFEFTPAQPASLSATNLFGTTNGDSATFSGSTPGQSVRFSSDFVDFTQTDARSLQIGLTGLSSPLALNANGFLNSFTASGTGSFSSDVPPTPTTTTAASVNIGGRVLNTSGRGIRGAQVSLTDGEGTVRTAISNSFGYYSFNEVAAGQTVIVAVTAKRYLFNSQVVSVGEELTGLNFTAIDQLQKSGY